MGALACSAILRWRRRIQAGAVAMLLVAVLSSPVMAQETVGLDSVIYGFTASGIDTTMLTLEWTAPAAYTYLGLDYIDSAPVERYELCFTTDPGGITEETWPSTLPWVIQPDPADPGTSQQFALTPAR